MPSPELPPPQAPLPEEAPPIKGELRRVNRSDVAPLAHVYRMDSGGIRITDQPIQRSGVQAYTNPDGSTRYEWRPQSEVQRSDSLARLRGAPLTLGHHGMVTSANWGVPKQVVGHVGDNVRPGPDGTVIGDVVVHHEDAIQAALAKRVEAVSMGYSLDLEETSGVTPAGERYDAIQRNIRPNHVALVKRGRAGQIVRLRLDGEEESDDMEIHEDADWDTAYMNNLPDSAFLHIAPGGSKDAEGKTVPRTLRYFPVRDAAGKVDLPHLRNALARIPQSSLSATLKESLTGKAQALLQRQDQMDPKDQEIAQLKGANAELKTRADAAEAELAKLPEKVRARARVLEQARSHGVEAREDQSDVDVMRAVCAKISPELKLEGKEPGFVAGAFESAVSKAKIRADADPRTVLNAAETHASNTRQDAGPPAKASWRQKRDEANRAARGEEKSK